MLYRKIFTKDRFPPVDVKVDSEKGDWWYNPNDPYVSGFPAYWYEEIREPTLEEMESRADGRKWDIIPGESHYASARYGFIEGYEQAFKDFKGEK